MIICFKGGQIAQTAQSGFNQFQSNPNQFVQASHEYILCAKQFLYSLNVGLMNVSSFANILLL